MNEKEKPKPYISRLVVKADKLVDKIGPCGYEIEFEFPYGTTTEEFEAARKSGLDAIQKWLTEKLGETKQTPQTNPLDPGELDKLPWKLYKQGHRAGWVFSDKAPELAEAIAHSEGNKLSIGDFIYDFSGPKDQDPHLFIRRTPIKEEKA